MANGIQKDLGKVTAYSYAKSAGYTGTEAEFQQVFDEFTRNAPGLITRMDTAVERAEAAVTEIDATVQDAVDEAVDEATASAVATANQAVTDAQAAQTAAEGAVTQANAAVTQANNAVTAAQAAQAAAEDAAASFVIDNTLTVSGAAADAKKTGDEISDLKEATSAEIDAINEQLDLELKTPSATVNSYVLRDNGTCAKITGYKLVKYTVTAGTKIYIKSATPDNDRASYQFQTSSSVPSSGTNSNLVGTPVLKSVVGYVTVPETATHIIFSALAEDTTVGIYEYKTIPELNQLKNDVYVDITTVDFGITWGQGGFNANSGQLTESTTSVRTNGYIDTEESSINKIFVTDQNYRIAVYGWNKSTKAYVGMWNGTEITTYSASRTYYYSEIDTSNFDSFLIKLRLKKTDESDITPEVGSKVSVNTVAFKKTEESPADYSGSEVSVFNKMLCIGDSLIAGGANHPEIEPDPTKESRVVTTSMYSVPTFITKMYGVETVNWGVSGATSKSWYNSKIANEPDWSGFDSALIYIGSNDYTYVTVDGLTIEQGAAQSKTYIENIIAKLKESNAGIRVFLCTLNPGATEGTYAKYRIPLIEKIREIAEADDSVFLVDMNTYGTLATYSPYHNGHPTAIGYQLMAKEMGSIMSYTISHDPSDFKWIRWIGTEYAVTDEDEPDPDEPDVG